MSFQVLKERVCRVNQQLVEAGLVVLTWGNASGVDREAGVMAIKPSGVGYDTLQPEDVVVVSLADGRPIEGRRRPSSDTPTHRLLYQTFRTIGGVVHTHSLAATSFAQAAREIPCLGTTHADHFHGPIPLARELTTKEIQSDYEHNTGQVIVERFTQGRLDPEHMPAVLVSGHASFVWGPTPETALENAVALEAVATMALNALRLNPQISAISAALLVKHFLRKHGPGAYYGQP